MQSLILRPRKPFLGIALAAIAGILLAERWPAPVVWVVGGTAVLALLTFAWPKAWLCHGVAGAAFFSLHILRHVHAPGAGIEELLLSGARPVSVTGVVWSEPTSGTSSRGQPRATFWLKIESLRIDGGEMRSGGLCLVRWSGKAPVYGDAVSIEGTAQSHEEVRNPGQFDTAGWLRRKGIRFQVVARNVSDCAVTGNGRGSKVISFAIAARAWVKAKLDLGLEDAPDVAALIESMVLGLRGETPPEMKGLFQKTGTLHLFAVSGLNVAMLGGIAWHLLKPLRLSRRAAVLVILPLLAAYAIVTGLSASCVRATVMAAFVLSAQFFERPAVAVNSLAAAAVAILAWDTNELFSPGFQLSFVLVLFIMALTSPIAQWMEPAGRPDDFIPRELWTKGERFVAALWRQIAQAGGVTLSAWMGSFIFMAGYFHLVSPVAILANAVAVPLAFCVLALGLMSLVCATFSTGLAVMVNAANWVTAKALLASLAAFAQVPAGYVYVETPRFGAAVACEITSLAVGDGAALHLRAGGGDWLLDCGGARDYERCLLPYLRSRGVNRLAGLMLTHGDTAHIGATLPLFEDFRPRWIGDTISSDRSPSRREIHAGLAATGFGRRYLQRGDEATLGAKAKFTVLFPPAGIVRTVADDRALVCRVEAAGLRALCVSDAGFSTERWLLANEADLRADVLIMGWHSRDISGTPDFLSRVRPVAIVSSEPPFGMPRERADELERECRALGATWFRQEKCGAVKIDLREDGEIALRSFLGNQTFRSRAR